MLSDYQCHSRDMFFIFILFLVHPSFKVVCLQILVRAPSLWFSCTLCSHWDVVYVRRTVVLGRWSRWVLLSVVPGQMWEALLLASCIRAT